MGNEVIIFGIVSLVTVILVTVAAVLCVTPVTQAKKKYGKNEFLFQEKFPFAGGLNLPEGVKCSVVCLRSGIAVSAMGQEFRLASDKIVSVSVMTRTQMQQQYVSSAGGAVAGALLLGPIGAILGGSASKRTIKSNTKYLIFAYQSDDEIKYILFDATRKPSSANRFKNRFKGQTTKDGIKVDL